MSSPVRYERAPEPVRRPSFIYCVLHHERRAAKIGRSIDPYKRLAQLQTGVADRLTMFDVIPGGPRLEGVFHSHFADRRLIGEWFDNADGAVRDLFARITNELRAASA